MMTLIERLRDLYNRGATFHPQVNEDEPPCIEIAGVHVFAYIHADGALRVSLHFDDAVEHPEVWPDGEDVGVPVKVDVGGAIVYEIDDQGRNRYPGADDRDDVRAIAARQTRRSIADKLFGLVNIHPTPGPAIYNYAHKLRES